MLSNVVWHRLTMLSIPSLSQNGRKALAKNMETASLPFLETTKFVPKKSLTGAAYCSK